MSAWCRRYPVDFDAENGAGAAFTRAIYCRLDDSCQQQGYGKYERTVAYVPCARTGCRSKPPWRHAGAVRILPISIT